MRRAPRDDADEQLRPPRTLAGRRFAPAHPPGLRHRLPGAEPAEPHVSRASGQASDDTAEAAARPSGYATEDLFSQLLERAVPVYTAPRPRSGLARSAPRRGGGAEEPASASGTAAETGLLVRGDRLVLGLMGVIGLIIVGALVVYLRDANRDQRAQPAVSVASDHPDVLAAEVWLAQNMTKSATVLTDPGVTRELSRRGVSSRDALIDSGSPDTAPYVLSTPDLRAAADHSTGVARLLRASLPVASFGGGATRVELRRRAIAGTAALQREWTADHAIRVQAGRQLLLNRRLTVSNAARTKLATGMLDLRAETLLALLVDYRPVRLNAVETDSSALSSDIPARILVVSAPHKRVQLIAAAMPASYRPSAVLPTADGQLRVRWALAPSAVRPSD